MATPSKKLEEINEDEILKDDDDEKQEALLVTGSGSANDVIDGDTMQVDEIEAKKAFKFPTPPGGVRPVKSNFLKGDKANAAPNPDRPIERVKRTRVNPEDDDTASTSTSTAPPPKKRINVNLSDQVATVVLTASRSATYEDLKIFQVALATAIAELHGNLKIKIQRVVLKIEKKKSRIQIFCVDQATLLWVEANVSKWNSGAYKLEEIAAPLIEVSFFIYGELEFDKNNFLKILGEQNDLNVSQWTLLKVYPHKPKKQSRTTGQIVVVDMPEDEYSDVEGKSLYYLINEIKPKLWNSKTKAEEKEVIETNEHSGSTNME